jgi:hypothetical protein
MAPCKSKGQPTFGISGSLEAAIERNVKVVFWVRVWHCVFTIDTHSCWTYRHRAQTVPMRLFDACLQQQQMAVLSLPPLSLRLCVAPSLH